MIQKKSISITVKQASKLKEYEKNGQLTLEMVEEILSEERLKKRKVTIQSDRIRQYFPDSYSDKEIEKVIISLLDQWKEKGAV